MTSAVTMSAWIYPTGQGSDPVYGGVILSKEGEYEVARFADGAPVDARGGGLRRGVGEDLR
jgi:hypothetical protein